MGLPKKKNDEKSQSEDIQIKFDSIFDEEETARSEETSNEATRIQNSPLNLVKESQNLVNEELKADGNLVDFSFDLDEISNDEEALLVSLHGENNELAPVSTSEHEREEEKDELDFMFDEAMAIGNLNSRTPEDKTSKTILFNKGMLTESEAADSSIKEAPIAEEMENLFELPNDFNFDSLVEVQDDKGTEVTTPQHGIIEDSNENEQFSSEDNIPDFNFEKLSEDKSSDNLLGPSQINFSDSTDEDLPDFEDEKTKIISRINSVVKSDNSENDSSAPYAFENNETDEIDLSTFNQQKSPRGNVVNIGFNENDKLVEEDEATRINHSIDLKSIGADNLNMKGHISSSSHFMSSMTDDQLTKMHLTLTHLREEREQLIKQIQNLKNEKNEGLQDNLTLKALLDESKLEVLILRKRHMTEVEELKYRYLNYEEKMQLAHEKVMQADSSRIKLEQKIRIDTNKIKENEKSLMAKIEMLSIDSASQINSRDQKILEFRRKIDALEFNMENVSNNEQKAKLEKRRAEDKLNKILKTLKHSMKNLEEDIDQANDEVQDNKKTNKFQLGKM